MKVKARKGVTIVYPVPAEGRQVVDRIPPDRNAVVVWHDQFGTVHGTAFGDIDTADPEFDKLVQRIGRKFHLFGPVEP